MANYTGKRNDSTGRYGPASRPYANYRPDGKPLQSGSNDAYDRLMAVFDKLSAHYGPVTVLYSEQAADGTTRNYLISQGRNMPGELGERYGQRKHCDTCTCHGHAGGLEKNILGYKGNLTRPTTRSIKPANHNYRQAA